MSITIGRFVGDVLQNVERQGDSLRLSGMNTTAGEIPRETSMQQFTGLAGNRDEPVVPIFTTDRPDLDGFYRPTRVSIIEVQKVTETAGIWRWAITLVRVGGGFAEPFFEQVKIGVKRTTGTAEGLAFAIHDDVESYDSLGTTRYTRTSEDGTVAVYSQTASAAGSASLARFSVAPQSYYLSSARIEVNRGGTWYPIVGRQVPAPDDLIGEWRLNNGLIRVFPSATLGALDLELYDPQGAAWVDVATFKHGYNDTFGDVEEQGIGVNTSPDGAGDPTFDAEIAPAILYNGPELVVIQFATLGFGLQKLSLRQGAYHVELNPANVSARAVWFSTTTACTSTDDSGIVVTTADGNGNRGMIMAAADDPDLNPDNTDGILETDNANVPFGLGVCVNNLSTGSFNGYNDIVDQFLGVFTMRRQAVGR